VGREIPFNTRRLKELIESIGEDRFLRVLETVTPQKLKPGRQLVWNWKNGKDPERYLPYLKLALGLESIDELFDWESGDGNSTHEMPALKP